MAQTINTANAQWGLNGKASPTRTNVAGVNTLGVDLSATLFGTANVLYSFEVVAGAGSDVATLTLSTGQVTTSGSPTVTNAGKDQEGNTLPTTARVYGILIECLISQACIVAGTWGKVKSDDLDFAGERLLYVNDSGDTGVASTVTLTFSETGGKHRVTVLGKTS